MEEEIFPQGYRIPDKRSIPVEDFVNQRAFKQKIVQAGNRAARFRAYCTARSCCRPASQRLVAPTSERNLTVGDVDDFSLEADVDTSFQHFGDGTILFN